MCYLDYESLLLSPPPLLPRIQWSFMEFNVASPALELHDANGITHSSSVLSGWVYGAYGIQIQLSGQQKSPTSNEQIECFSKRAMLWMSVRA